MRRPARRVVAGGLVLLLAQATTGSAQPAGEPAEGAVGSRAFLVQAAHAGQAEVALGKLAFDKADSPAVKQFAQRMVQDHARANQELAELARQQRWVMPNAPAKKHQAEEVRLGRMSGDAFDRAYMHHMVKEHERMVRLFEQATRQIDELALRTWAAQRMPIIRDHLDRARSVLMRLGRAEDTRG